MRILLINPLHDKTVIDKEFHKLAEPTTMGNIFSWNEDYPLELAYISSQLKEHDVKIIDAHSLKLRPKRVWEEMKIFHPDILGIVTTTTSGWRCPIPTLNHVNIVINLVSKLPEKPRIILMGPHFSLNSNNFGKVLGDVFIRTEPEFIFSEIIKNINNLAKVEGITYREGNNIIHNKPAKSPDINKLPLPSFDLLPMENYTNFTVFSTRGCSYSCIFCYKDMIGDRLVRTRDIKKVIKEIESLSKHGITSFSFMDETFTLFKKRAISLCSRIISDDLRMKWTCQTRPDFLDEELLEVMKQAGCEGIAISIESANPNILKNIKKGFTVQQTYDAVKLCKKHKISVFLFVVTCLPGETINTLHQTKKFILETDPEDLGICLATPIPGTELFEMGNHENKIKSSDWEECIRAAGTIGTNFDFKIVRKLHRKFMYEVHLRRILNPKHTKKSIKRASGYFSKFI